jgi:hypothetical protein
MLFFSKQNYSLICIKMLLLTFAVSEKKCRKILLLAKYAKSDSSSVRSQLFSGREGRALYNNDYYKIKKRKNASISASDRFPIQHLVSKKNVNMQ